MLDTKFIDICKAARKPDPRLWELSQEMILLEDEIADILEDESLTEQQQEEQVQSLFSQWLAVGDNFEDKALKVAAYVKHQEALAEARRQEYRRLRVLAEQSERQADRLKTYLIREMQRTGKAKIEGVTGKISLRKKPAKVCLNCEPSDVPSDFVAIEYRPLLNAIKAHIKENPDTQWAYLSDRDEYGLIIK